MNCLARRLMMIFAIIAIILITIISTVLRFNLTTILFRVVVGGLVFGLIGGILGEIIYRNINHSMSENYVSEGQITEEEIERYSEEDMQNKQAMDNMEPLEFEEVADEDINVVNNIDGEEGAEMVRQMSQDN